MQLLPSVAAASCGWRPAPAHSAQAGPILRQVLRDAPCPRRRHHGFWGLAGEHHDPWVVDQHVAHLVAAVLAELVIEVGTFTGYSSTAIALALPQDGQLVCCDVSEEWTSLASKYWDEAGVADKIDLRIAPAAETLDQLLADGEEDGFDFAFIDADKAGYDGYYERLLRLVRPGGLIALDNTLWSGKVLNQDADDEDTRELQALNVKLADDERITLCLLPVADGVTLARRR